MKQILNPLYISFLIVVFTSVSCKKEKANTPSSSGSFTNSLKFDIDTAYAYADSVRSLDISLQNGTVNFLSYAGDNFLALEMDTTIQVGTYVFANDPNSIPRMVYFNNANEEPYFSINGQLTILEHDQNLNTIKGQFYGKVQKPNDLKIRTVSNGFFRIKY